MNDALTPRPESGSVPYAREPWEEEWMNENDGAYRAHRERGLDVLHRIKDGLALTPREEAYATYINSNPSWEMYRKIDPEGTDTAMIMAEQIGTFLTNPESAVGELSRIAKLSDERPPEATK